uniref:Odorant binding protein n=1 Tax=Micromelalopha troglodyta TaxID=660574 RepID=A0A8E4KZJ6_9NEOP|nr:odorant binding protein [Micromelalopha troglodyta]
MITLKVCFFLFAFVGISSSAFVDNLHKCKINNGDCERELVQSVIRDIAKTGVPELKIPPIDPIALKNVSIKVVDLIDFTIIEGTVKGIKDCVVDKFVTDVEKEKAFMELTCDITLKARYKVFSNSPLIKTFLGGETVHGDGNLKVKIEKIHIRFDYFFYIQKRADEIYIKCKRNKTIYDYSILGNLNVQVDNLYLGKQESSQMIADLINQNWKLLIPSFGKPFMDTAMEFVYEFVHKFFDNVPLKHYILDDVSQYARE